MLGLPGFEFDTSEQVRDAVLGDGERCCRAARQRHARRDRDAPRDAAGGVERVADVPIYFADPLVRRSPSLQLTRRRAAAARLDERARCWRSSALAEGDAVRVARAAARRC